MSNRPSGRCWCCGRPVYGRAVRDGEGVRHPDCQPGKNGMRYGIRDKAKGNDMPAKTEDKDFAEQVEADVNEIVDTAETVNQLAKLEGDNIDLLAALDIESEGWRPEPGDKILGRVVSVGNISSEFGDYPMVQLLTNEGALVNVHCFHSVMRSAIERFTPKHGDDFAAKYIGRKDTGGFNDAGYENYTVIVRPHV